MGVSWTDEQKQAIDNRGGTLLVSAAAGSGKTAVLVQRVLDRVTDSENPCDVDSFLIVTFTKAAASEMRGKIADALTELAAKQPQNLRLRRQLMLVHRAKITTVHAFCMSLVKEHFHELGLPPEFRTADDSEQTAMQQEVLEEVLEAQYAVDGAGSMTDSWPILCWRPFTICSPRRSRKKSWSNTGRNLCRSLTALQIPIGAWHCYRRRTAAYSTALPHWRMRWMR